MQNFRTLEQHLYEKSNSKRREKKEEREKYTVNSGHFVLPATPNGSMPNSLGQTIMYCAYWF
jgi:hypothetical protein